MRSGDSGKYEFMTRIKIRKLAGEMAEIDF